MQTTRVSLTAFVLAAIGMGGFASPFQQNSTTKNTQTKSKAVYRSYLEADSRLKEPLTLDSPSCTHLRLWGAFTHTTGVRIEREDAAGEFDTSAIALAGKDVPVRAWMDAVAARVLGRWERMDKKGYRFLVTQDELDFVHIPREEHEKERFRIGADFLRDFDRLPAEEQARIASGKFVSFSSLPEKMQQAISGMLETFSQELRERNGGDTVQTSDLPSGSFRLEPKPVKGFKNYFLTVKVPGVGSSGWRINDYQEQRRAQEAARQQQAQKGELGDLYAPVKFEISQEEAKRLPALQRKVSLDTENVTFPEVLQKLHEKYDISFLTDPKRDMPQKADIHLPPMKLGEALDRLTEIYHDTQWEWRKYGFLIVRGPSNPARTVKQGQYATSSGGTNPAPQTPVPSKPSP